MLQVVLTSMHKYVPRIWIIHCDDVTRLSDLYSHPASSFKFIETEFIAVTAYQVNARIYIRIESLVTLPFKYLDECKVTLLSKVDGQLI